MSKAILVMDMPKSCIFCPLSDWANCRITKNCHTADSRPDDCPLHELPQKQTIHCTDTAHYRHAKDGYNACIDEIVRGSEENGIDKC